MTLILRTILISLGLALLAGPVHAKDPKPLDLSKVGEPTVFDSLVFFNWNDPKITKGGFEVVDRVLRYEKRIKDAAKKPVRVGYIITGHTDANEGERYGETLGNPNNPFDFRDPRYYERELELLGTKADPQDVAEVRRKLSLARAEAVAEAMQVRLGIDPKLINVRGVGDTDLRVPTLQGVREAQNRRVVITMVEVPE